MSPVRIMRYILSVVIAVVLMGLILPRVGIPQSRMLPPSAVFSHADGTAEGKLYKKYSLDSADYLHFGTKNYFIDYKFQAVDPAYLVDGQAPKNAPKKEYTGAISVNLGDQYAPTADSNLTYASFNESSPIPVKVIYEKSNPDVNGIVWPDGPKIGCRAGNDMFGGWLIYPAIALVLGWFISLPLERFGKREDI